MDINYIDLLQKSAKMIQVYKQTAKDNLDSHQLAELYGMYYNAFAGALRSGTMFSKQMDTDGYAKYIITVAGHPYVCREAPLRDILQNDFETVTQYPYDDTSASYVKPYVKVIRESDNYIAATEEAFEKEASQKEQNSRRQTGKPAKSNKNRARDKQEALRAEQRKETEIIKAKTRELQKSAREFKYDPNYDHYYSDRLPELLKELDSGMWKTVTKVAGIVIACGGIILAMTLIR